MYIDIKFRMKPHVPLTLKVAALSDYRLSSTVSNYSLPHGWLFLLFIVINDR